MHGQMRMMPIFAGLPDFRNRFLNYSIFGSNIIENKIMYTLSDKNVIKRSGHNLGMELGTIQKFHSARLSLIWK